MVDTILDFGAANSLQTLFYQIISQTLQLTSAVNSSPWYKALQRLPQTIRPNGDETDDGTDCVILSICDLER